MPRPLSRTETDPSTWMMTSIFEQNPARCSSIELSRTSNTMWCRPRSSGSPMYMPGRFRTASRPSSLSICAASYFCAVFTPVIRSEEENFAVNSSSVLGIEDGRATTVVKANQNRLFGQQIYRLFFGSETPDMALEPFKNPASCARSYPWLSPN